MSDSFWCGRSFCTFNVVDDYNREVLAFGVDLNLPALRIIGVLGRVALTRGYPRKLRLDNDPELTSTRLAKWAEDHGVELGFIEHGKPTQNSYVERFNRTYREEILDMYVFRYLDEVREITENWITEYNEERPNESLGNMTPAEYLSEHLKTENSSLDWH